MDSGSKVWIQEKLGKKASFSKGKGYKKSDLVSKGHPILLYGEMYTNYRESISTGITFVADDQNSVKSNGEEVVVPSSGESAIDIARASSIKMPNLILGGDLNIIYPDESIDNDFLALSLSNGTVKRELSKKAQGTSITHLYNNDLKNVVFYYPIVDEQLRISESINIISKIITLEQEKLAHYHAMKKALSTSIFPKNNESLPNLTFNGDGGWKQQKLEDFLSIPDKVKVEVTDTDEILSVKLNTNGVVGGESRSTLKLGATTYYRRYSGQFIYGKQNFFNGAMAIIPEALNYKVSSGDIPSLNISNINPIFLYEYLSRPYYYKQTEAMASGTGSKRIHEKTLLNFKIKVPNNDIQDNIEQLFTNLTALLDSQNNKVNKMIQIKKVLLNNLFV